MSAGDTYRLVYSSFPFLYFLRFPNAFTDIRSPFLYHLSAVPSIVKVDVKFKITGIMKVVVIDKATFERMLSGFKIFAEKVERLCREHEDLGEKEWLDSDDICRQLCVSPRPLQTMGVAYTEISHKVYYRLEDVKTVFPVVEMKRRMTADKGRKCNVTNQ